MFYCMQCGQKLRALITDGPAHAPAFHYGGFWRRFAARIIDGLILGSVLVLWLGAYAGLMFVYMKRTDPASLDALHTALNDPEGGAIVLAVLGVMGAWVASLLGLVWAWLYYAVFESSPWQATPGKRFLGLRVTDLEGRRISFGRASGRFFAKLVTGLTFGIGYLLAAFTKRKQALHDMIANCLVLRRDE
jgi:uncharacterized RDD family membrane protein YckC